MRMLPVVFGVILFSCILFWRIAAVQKSDYPDGTMLTVTGTIDSWPAVSGRTQSFTIDGLSILVGAFPAYDYGDLLSLTGSVQQGKLFYPHVTRIKTEQGQRLVQYLYDTRQQFLITIRQLLPEPAASLVAGIVLGVHEIPADLRTVLIATGTIHIVVVSGQNVSLVAGFFAGLASWFGRRKTLALSAVAATLYALLVGFDPPVMRALFMSLLAFSAQALGRQQWGVWALLVTVFFMVFYDPAIAGSLSFQLSVLSTAGVLLLAPILSARLSFLPRLIRQDLSVTVAAQLLVVPLLTHTFGMVSLVAPLANLAVAPLVVPILALGMLLVIVGSFVTVLGQLVALVITPFSLLFVWLITEFSKLPFASLQGVHIDTFIIVLYYIVLIGGVLWRSVLTPPVGSSSASVAE